MLEFMCVAGVPMGYLNKLDLIKNFILFIIKPSKNGVTLLTSIDVTLNDVMLNDVTLNDVTSLTCLARPSERRL